MKFINIFSKTKNYLTKLYCKVYDRGYNGYKSWDIKKSM